MMEYYGDIMKIKLVTLAFLMTGTIVSANAQSDVSCSQSNLKFLEVARDYSSCNSITGSDSLACNRFCEAADKLLSSGYPGGPSQPYCSPEEIRSIQQQARLDGAREGRQQGRDEVIRDLSVREEAVSQDFYGLNEDDCSRRASQSTEQLKIDVIRKCNSKASSIRNCYIQNEKITGSFGRPPKFEGKGHFKKDDNRSTQDECQKNVLADATTQAMSNCLNSTGQQCSILSAETILTHRVKSPSGPRFGRRDERICDATVFAEAPRDLTYKCNVKLSARNQVSAN